MKDCPFCGAALQDGTVSFCSECGKEISSADAPAIEELDQKAFKRKSHDKKCSSKSNSQKHHSPKKENTKRRSRGKDIPEVMREQVDDGYDGYYDDVLPPDADRVADSIDKELVKKVVALCIGVSFIISMCVVLLYIL